MKKVKKHLLTVDLTVKFDGNDMQKNIKSFSPILDKIDEIIKISLKAENLDSGSIE